MHKGKILGNTPHYNPRKIAKCIMSIRWQGCKAAHFNYTQNRLHAFNIFLGYPHKNHSIKVGIPLVIINIFVIRYSPRK